MEQLKQILSISPELRNRVLSASLLAPIVLFILWYGGLLYQAMVLVAAIIISFEWYGIISSPLADEQLSPESKKRWVIAGGVYAFMFAFPLLYLRSLDVGFGVILLLLFFVWSTDIAAYFTGRAIGGPKILPKVSPKKTWSGLFGGMVASGLVGAASAVFLTEFHIIILIAGGMLLAVVAQIGDFFESWVKRRFGVKDSSHLIPGHGGLMDRVDGIVTAAPLMAIIAVVKLSGWGL